MRLQSRLFWLLVLLGHAVVAAAWWWFKPGGFAADHPKFWLNRVLPAVVVAACLTAVIAFREGRTGITRLVLVGLATFWINAAVGGRLAFPVSLRVRFLALLAAGAVVGLACFAPSIRGDRFAFAASPRLRRRRTWTTALVGGLAAPVGWFAAESQRAPDPTTLPSAPLAASADLAELDDLTHPPLPSRAVTLASGVTARVSDGRLSVADGRYVVEVEPLLTFVSRSPDRCWTNLAPPADRLGPGRHVEGWSASGGELRVRYADDGDTRLVARAVDTADGRAAVEATATTTLGRPVYSHLNTSGLVFVAGHRRLWASFSPCPGERIEVLPSDYPVGRPACAAAVFADGTFRVVEASSGEKGPFRTLAAGRVGRDHRLTIGFHDAATGPDGSPLDRPADEPFAVVSLPDFLAQASVAPSPTAGWGFPQNAVEFSIQGEEADDTAALFVSFAATSVGRGWDSVGHAAGTYSTAVRAEVVDAASRASGPSR